MKEADDRTIDELKEKLIIANGILDMEDIIRPQGHISARIPGTDTLLITRAIASGMATLDDIVVVNALDAEVISGEYTSTFGEVLAHAAVYQKRKDMNSVAHSHSLYVRALSIAETGDTPLLPVSFEIMKVAHKPETIGFYKEIWHLSKIHPKACFDVAYLLGQNSVVILKAHGAVIATKSIEETTTVAINMEEAAKLQVMAACLKPLVPFTAEELFGAPRKKRRNSLGLWPRLGILQVCVVEETADLWQIKTDHQAFLGGRLVRLGTPLKGNRQRHGKGRRNGMTDTTEPSVKSGGMSPDTKRFLWLLLAIAMGAAAYFSPLVTSGIDRKVFAITILMMVMWITEILDLAVTSLVGCLLFWIWAGIPLVKSFSGFFSDTPWFVLGVLLLGVMAETTGLARRLAYNIICRLGTSYGGILAGMMFLNFLFTFIMPSANAKCLIFCTISVGSLETFGMGKKSNIGRGLILAMTYQASFFSVFVIAGAAAIVAKGLMESFGKVQVTYAI